VGFLVDRRGAGGILLGGVALGSAAMIFIGLFPTYPALVAGLVVGGLANAAYHPADYAILNGAVAPERMGRAFSFHTFAGFLGDALAPVTILFLAGLVGWGAGLVICGLAGMLVAVLLAFNSRILGASAPGGAAAGGPVAGGVGGLGLLFSLPVVMGLLFYMGLAMGARGVGGFSVAALDLSHDATIAAAGMVLSAYLFAAPVGVLLGGHIADRIQRHGRFVAACFVVMGVVMGTVALFHLPLLAVGVLFALVGLCYGAVAPSRDMLIRGLAPPGQTGKVFGFVSTGFDLGGMIAPPIFGLLLDHGQPAYLFLGVALIYWMTVATVLGAGRRPEPRAT
jgi:MFS family permease